MSSTIKSLKSTGRLFGIGVGPGDPDLITLKAYKVLSRIPVILIPQKDKESGSLAYSVIQQYVTGPEQKIESLIFPIRNPKHKQSPTGRRRRNVSGVTFHQARIAPLLPSETRFYTGLLFM
jgi:precorrin-2 methylase